MWWLRLGIEIERIKPGHPRQNGRHERMHLTLKLETTKPAARNFLQQQAKFDDFIACYNNERPHQALNMQYPAERYVPSTRPYQGLQELDYPLHDKTVTVTTCGRICFNRQKCYPCLQDETQPMCPERTRTGLAGAPGFEPGNAGIKIRCLTTWLRPNDLRPEMRRHDFRQSRTASRTIAARLRSINVRRRPVIMHSSQRPCVDAGIPPDRLFT